MDLHAMGPSIRPHDWNDFFVECLYYFVPLSVVHIAAFIAGSLVIMALSRRNTPGLFRRIRRFGLFLALLLVAGSLFNAESRCVLSVILYLRTNNNLDSIPSRPTTQRVVGRPFWYLPGQLFGITVSQLNFVWLLFALGTWAGTVLSYR